MQYAVRYVERRTTGGHLFGTWEDCDMARALQWFLDSVIYLYPSERAAKNGEAFGGSGVIVYDGDYHFAVTCAHVINDRLSWTVRLNTTGGRHATIPLTKADWICEAKDDLAVAIIDPMPSEFKYVAVPV